jgi:hypothetical protein
MPNATVRANARTLLEGTNRRAVLGAVLAAGAAVATALPAIAATEAPALSATDRRVLDLWRRRTKILGIVDRLHDKCRAAYDKLPEWARSGPVYFRADGNPAGLPRESRWPMVADLNRRPVDANGLINARPSPDDLRNEFWLAFARGDEVTALELERSLAEHADRQFQQEAEQKRVGVDTLVERSDDANDAFLAVEKKIEEQIGASVLALAGVLIEAIDGNLDEDIPGLYRAALAAIRPRLVSVIAEDADRVLAAANEGRV